MTRTFCDECSEEIKVSQPKPRGRYFVEVVLWDDSRPADLCAECRRKVIKNEYPVMLEDIKVGMSDEDAALAAGSVLGALKDRGMRIEDVPF